MSIRDKIKEFFLQLDKTHTEIGFLYGVSQQTITNYLNGKREIPLTFILWLKQTYPEIDLNSLFSEEYKSIVSESKVKYARKNSKEEALKEIGEIMDKYF